MWSLTPAVPGELRPGALQPRLGEVYAGHLGAAVEQHAADLAGATGQVEDVLPSQQTESGSNQCLPSNGARLGDPVAGRPIEARALPDALTQQAQKEVTDAAALNRLDELVQPWVQQIELNTPLGSPAEGACCIIRASPTGAWARQANRLSQCIGCVWAFCAPFVGLVVLDASTLVSVRFQNEPGRG
jgi:hypothetical protein